MHSIDFWRLERSVQERFIAATQGAAAPAPLAIRAVARDPQVIVWAGLGLAALLGTLFAVHFGFGELESRYAIAPTWFIALYAAGFVLAAFAFLKAYVRSVHAHAVPYRPALYLFPVGVIDARTPRLVVHPISERTTASADPSRACLCVDFSGERFDFPAGDSARAALAAAAINELRDRLADAGPESSARERALVDPLIDNGFKNPFAPTESLRKVLPSWLRTWPFLALFLGVLLGGVAFVVRNHLSEARLYDAARRTDRSDTYRLYLERGGKNPDVTNLLLPRAELRDAMQQGNVPAIEHYLDLHPNTPIRPEVDAELQHALLKELRTAEATGTLSALTAFAAHYSSYPFLGAPIAQAVNTRVTATLARLKPELAPNQSHLLPFIERLLRYTAKHGPEALVRFQRKPTETLETAEKALRKNPYFSGEQCLPGAYFDDAHEAPREAATASAIAAAFAPRFPSDLLTLKEAPAVGPTDDSPARVPTLLITYHVEMSGAFMSRQPRFALSGIGLIAKASFEIPGDPEPLSFKLAVWRAPDLKTVTNASTPTELYDTMATEAFKRFTKKYLASWFVEH